jgi:hypothetical protein
MTAEQNKGHLMMMSQLLATIAICGDEEDIKMAARGVSMLDRNLVNRYWERCQALPAMMEEEVMRTLKEKAKS